MQRAAMGLDVEQIKAAPIAVNVRAENAGVLLRTILLNIKALWIPFSTKSRILMPCLRSSRGLGKGVFPAAVIIPSWWQ